MGLLEDAIRDHLELKRRRGADPGEVAREQREVMDFGFDPGEGREEPGAALAERSFPVRAGALLADPAPATRPPAEPSGRPFDEAAMWEEPAQGRPAAGAQQDTVEFDMEALLGLDEEHREPAEPQPAASAPPSPAAQMAADLDALEWETPRVTRASASAAEALGAEQPAELPGQERLQIE